MILWYDELRCSDCDSLIGFIMSNDREPKTVVCPLCKLRRDLDE